MKRSAAERERAALDESDEGQQIRTKICPHNCTKLNQMASVRIDVFMPSQYEARPSRDASSATMRPLTSVSTSLQLKTRFRRLHRSPPQLVAIPKISAVTDVLDVSDNEDGFWSGLSPPRNITLDRNRPLDHSLKRVCSFALRFDYDFSFYMLQKHKDKHLSNDRDNVLAAHEHPATVCLPSTPPNCSRSIALPLPSGSVCVATDYEDIMEFLVSLTPAMPSLVHAFVASGCATKDELIALALLDLRHIDRWINGMRVHAESDGAVLISLRVVENIKAGLARLAKRVRACTSFE